MIRKTIRKLSGNYPVSDIFWQAIRNNYPVSDKFCRRPTLPIPRTTDIASSSQLNWKLTSTGGYFFFFISLQPLKQ